MITMSAEKFQNAVNEVVKKANHGMIEIPNSIMRGISHILISDEVEQAIEELHLNGEEYKTIKDKVSLHLNRNDQQVGYYVRELSDNDKINAIFYNDKPCLTEKAYKVIKAIWELGGKTTISRISELTGMTWSAIRSTFYGTVMGKYVYYYTDTAYDERGRKHTNVELTTDGIKYCREYVK
jgi:hypothetical protein